MIERPTIGPQALQDAWHPLPPQSIPRLSLGKVSDVVPHLRPTDEGGYYGSGVDNHQHQSHARAQVEAFLAPSDPCLRIAEALPGVVEAPAAPGRQVGAVEVGRLYEADDFHGLALPDPEGLFAEVGLH